MTDIPCPGGIPPWDMPVNGETLAYEGWAEWVEENGTLNQRMQLAAYRVETLGKIFTKSLMPAIESAAHAMTNLMRVFGSDNE